MFFEKRSFENTFGAPGAAQERPREPQEAQKAPQEASNTSKRVPKNALETKKEPHQASIKQRKSTWPYILFATMSVEATSR